MSFYLNFFKRCKISLEKFLAVPARVVDEIFVDINIKILLKLSHISQWHPESHKIINRLKQIANKKLWKSQKQMKPHSHIQRSKMFCIQKIFLISHHHEKVFLNRKLLFININEKLFLSVNDIYRNVPTSSSSSLPPSSSSSCSKSFILLLYFPLLKFQLKTIATTEMMKFFMKTFFFFHDFSRPSF